MPHSRTKNLAPMVVTPIVLVLVLAGCPANQPAPTATPTQPAATVALQPPIDMPTEPPSPTAPPATATPTAAPTDASTPTPRPPIPTPAPPTATPTPAPTDTATAAPQPQTARSANLRAGPGTNYAVVGSAAAQQASEPVGRNGAGDWLQIDTAAGEAWIAAFLVENVDGSGLPVRQSAAPTVTPVPPAPAATPRPAAQAPSAASPVSCGATVAAPANLEIIDQLVEIRTYETRFGAVQYSLTALRLKWRWIPLDQAPDGDWYFDVQVLLGAQAGNPLLRTMRIEPNQATNTDGLWTGPTPGTTAAGNAIAPEFFASTCPPGEPRCPLHVRVQVALSDSSGNFACFISPPSNVVPLPIP